MVVNLYISGLPTDTLAKYKIANSDVGAALMVDVVDAKGNFRIAVNELVSSFSAPLPLDSFSCIHGSSFPNMVKCSFYHSIQHTIQVRFGDANWSAILFSRLNIVLVWRFFVPINIIFNNENESLSG